MVVVYVGVTKRVNEFSGLVSGDLCHHLQQQRIGRDIERHSEEEIRAALVQLQAQPVAIDEELEHGVTRRQRHSGDIGDVPRRNDMTPGIRNGANLANETAELIDRLPVRCAPRTPLHTVDRSQVTRLRIGPLIPNPDAVLFEICHVRVPGDEPEQLVDHRLDMNFLGRDEGKTRREVVANLASEDAMRPGTRAVHPVCSVL